MKPVGDMTFAFAIPSSTSHVEDVVRDAVPHRVSLSAESSHSSNFPIMLFYFVQIQPLF
jgi:hypothetical protein